jgi:hypothetical protein
MPVLECGLDLDAMRATTTRFMASTSTRNRERAKRFRVTISKRRDRVNTTNDMPRVQKFECSYASIFFEGYTDTKSTIELDRLRMATHTLRGVLVYMSCDGFAIDDALLYDQ